MRYAVLTSSDSGHAGNRKDIGGDALVDVMSERGHTLIARSLQPDDEMRLTEQILGWVERGDVELILTTGGTGLAPRDVTPEATKAVIDYEVPGVAEAMRAASLRITPMAMLSRAVVGVAKQTMIVNLPGSPKGAVETLEVVLDVLPHAIEILRDTHTGDHPVDRQPHKH